MIPVFFSVVSCEGNLEPQLFDQITPENFLNNETDMKTAVTGVYSEFRGATEWGRYKTSWGSLMTLQEIPTDEFASTWNRKQHTDFMWKPTDYWVTEIFNFFVPAVTKATSLIERIKDAKIAVELKNRYIDELRTVRALWMYDLFDLYGTVPVVVKREDILNPTNTLNINIKRPTRDWYVSFLENELKSVIDSGYLKVDWGVSEYGHVTKGTAMMVLLQLYMHEGGYCRTNNIGNCDDWFRKAEHTATQIMDLNYYKLQPEFKDIWSPSNQHNKEIIFSLPSFPIPVMGNNALAHALPTDYKSRQGIPTTGWGGDRTPWTIYDSFDPSDKRRQTNLIEYLNTKDVVVTGRTGEFSQGAIPYKYPENSKTDGTNSASEYVIYRYADVILLRAEAKNELYGPSGGGSPTAKDLLNIVRNRAFDNYEGSPQKAIVDNLQMKDEFRDHLFKERTWELIWEGKRRSDLIRWGIFISNAQLRGKKVADIHHCLYPIPQQTIYDLKIDQNPGY